jgi:hypothetical protein
MSLIDTPYRQTARRSFPHYLMLVGGLVFVVASLSVDPAVHCRESGCPQWLIWSAFGLGALFAAGGAAALLRNAEWGSRIDHAKRQLVWWQCVPPVVEKTIAIDDIREIRIDTSSDSNTLRLVDSAGKFILFSGSCVPSGYGVWADQLARRYPHIKVTKK